MAWRWSGVLLAFWIASPAAANDEFGREILEARPGGNPPRDEATPRHEHTKRHNHGHHKQPKLSASHGDKHSRPRTNGDAGHNHDHDSIETEHLFGFTKGTDVDPPPGAPSAV